MKTSLVPRRVTATDALGIGTGSRGALEPLVVTLGMATVLTHAAHYPELGDSKVQKNKINSKLLRDGFRSEKSRQEKTYKHLC